MEKSVMVIAPHPDDAELGMGGTIAALRAKGYSVAIADLTNGEPTPFGSLEIRAKETIAASKVLGITQRECLGIKNREIQDTIENRKIVAAAIRRYRPDVLFIPYWEDSHPDHLAAYALAVAGRFYSKLSNTDIAGEPWYPRKIISYFAIHLRPKITPSFVFDISSHFTQKLESVMSYHSQFAANPKNEFVKDLLTAEAAYWGVQVGVKYGEAFVSQENIRIADPGVLLEL